MVSSSSSSSSLVQQLAACFVEDPVIDEYDFVLLPPPIDNARIAAAAPAAPFVLEAHKLGIATWALKLIFKEALGMFRRITADAAKTREGGKEGHGGNREEGDKKIAMQQNATRALLMINPDMYTAWNVRKRLIVEGKLSEVAELTFLDLVFSKHTKKASAWAHRRWCLARLLVEEVNRSEKANEATPKKQKQHLQQQGKEDEEGEEEEQQQQQQWSWGAQQEKELKMTARIAEAFPKNYYAWTHRWWVVGGKEKEAAVVEEEEEESGEGGEITGRRSSSSRRRRRSRSGSGSDKEQEEEAREEVALLQQQVEFAREWAGRHVWDMSAVNYLQQVLTRIVSISCSTLSSSSFTENLRDEHNHKHHQQQQQLNPLALLESLPELNAASLDIYPGHESLWYQRRGLLELWLTTERLEIRRKGGVGAAAAAGEGGGGSAAAAAATASLSSSFSSSSTLLSETGLFKAEMARASHYMRGEGPWDGGDGGEGGLLWDVAARRKQRLSAWAHKCWVVLRWKGKEDGGGKEGEEEDGQQEKEKEKLREELMALEASDPLLFVPPGYKHLLTRRQQRGEHGEAGKNDGEGRRDSNVE